MEACADESIYLFEATDENDSTTLYGNGLRRTTSNVTLSGSRSHRRKRLRDNLARLAQDGETPLVKIRRAPSTNITVLEKSQADLSDTIIGKQFFIVRSTEDILVHLIKSYVWGNLLYFTILIRWHLIKSFMQFYNLRHMITC